jgi:AraC-like DNA-binding protein
MNLPKTINGNDDFLRLRDVGKYIHEHYGEDISVNLLAKVACMSATKFKMSFRKMYGDTVHSYVRHVRMDMAVKLLRKGDMSIMSIAQTVGYRKPGAFAAAFRKEKGLLPSDCRNKWK